LVVITWNIFFLVHLLVSILVGTIMTISKDRVKPSPIPDSWKLSEIFATGIVLGSYLALMTVIFFYIVVETDFFPVSIFLPVVHYFVLISLNAMTWSIFPQNHFGVKHFHYNPNAEDSDPTKRMLGSAVYLQVSTISQALIFVTRSRGWSYTERPGLLLVTAFIIAQAVHGFLNLPELFKPLTQFELAYMILL